MKTDPEQSGIDSFESNLQSLDELNEETAQNLRDQLLEVLEVSDSWSLIGDEAELCVDDSAEWELFTLSHDNAPDQSVTVFAQPGSHTLQTYLEPAGVFTEPSQSVGYIQTALDN